VRPDGYVAWRCTPGVWEDAQALHLLEDALTTVLAAPVGEQTGRGNRTPSYDTSAVFIGVPQAGPADRGRARPTGDR
jgi:hypothetical protein